MSVANRSAQGFGGSNLSSFSNTGSGIRTAAQQPQQNGSLRVNPLVFPSLNNLDVDKLEEDLAKEIQRKKINEERERRNVQKIFEESSEINELKQRIRFAHINQERSKQILEKQTRRLQDLVKDAETDESLLTQLDEERFRVQESEIKKKMDRLNSKYVLQQQMKEKDKLKEESRQEYLRDKQLVDDVVKKLMMEDMNSINENKRKKSLAKTYMNQAYEEKEFRKLQQKEDERLQKEKERQYFEEVARRDKEQKEKKAAIQEEKDKIFDKLSAEAARQQAEKDYWENVRTELYWEETNRRQQIKDLQEKEKKQRQKEEMLQSAIEQMQIKEERKKDQENLESEFKKKLMEKFAADERLEQYNAQRRRTKEIELKKEV
jgi:hypothetical protein